MNLAYHSCFTPLVGPIDMNSGLEHGQRREDENEQGSHGAYARYGNANIWHDAREQQGTREPKQR